MIIVQLKEGENIERALKKFKRKYEKTGVVKELRRRQAFIKPSVDKRKKREHAVYVQQMQQIEDQFAICLIFQYFRRYFAAKCGKKNS